MKHLLTVSELTRRIQLLLESHFGLVWIEGEISNLRRPASGHVYFTLKDEKSQIRAVVFRQALRNMTFALEDGMQIVCRATVNVYEQRGEYQLVIDTVEPRGIGALQIAFEQLKARLQAEGLFDSVHKKPIPFLPRRIGVITSPSGAVIRDILTVTARRFPSIDILIFPVRVQGEESAAEIVAALDRLSEQTDVDVAILARGGGSLEDLSPFNDERVARAIFRSQVPIVSAVGHEVDFTIADFVADLRAPTPSAAAELVAPLRGELLKSVQMMRLRLEQGCRRMITASDGEVESLRQRLKHPGRQILDLRIYLDEMGESLRTAVFKRIKLLRDGLQARRASLRYVHPGERIKNRRAALILAEENFTHFFRMRVAEAKNRLAAASALLDNLSPLKVLGRGYSIVQTYPEGHVVRDAESLRVGRMLDIRLAAGSVRAEVKDILQR